MELAERLRFGADLERRLNEGDSYDALCELATQLERFPSLESQRIASECSALLERRSSKEFWLLVIAAIATLVCASGIVLAILTVEHALPGTRGLQCGACGVLLLLAVHGALVARNAFVERRARERLSDLVSKIEAAT